MQNAENDPPLPPSKACIMQFIFGENTQVAISVSTYPPSAVSAQKTFVFASKHLQNFTNGCTLNWFFDFLSRRILHYGK